MREDYEIEKRNRLRSQREKIQENIIRQENAVKQEKFKGPLYTPLFLEELMNKSKDGVKVILKDAKKTKIKTDLDYKAHIASVFSQGGFGCDNDIWRLTDLLDEIYRTSKGHVGTLKQIKKYINKNLKSKNYKYAALVDGLLEALAELNYELNEYREDTLLKGNYYGEKFSYETRNLDFAVETGMRALILDKPNKKKA